MLSRMSRCCVVKNSRVIPARRRVFWAELVGPYGTQEGCKHELHVHVHHGNEDWEREAEVVGGEHPLVVDREDRREEIPSASAESQGERKVQPMCNTWTVIRVRTMTL